MKTSKRGKATARTFVLVRVGDVHGKHELRRWPGSIDLSENQLQQILSSNVYTVKLQAQATVQRQRSL
jgi:hypothetical protein